MTPLPRHASSFALYRARRCVLTALAASGGDDMMFAFCATLCFHDARTSSRKTLMKKPGMR